MNQYIEALNTYLEEHRPRLGCLNVDSLLDMLYCCYHQQNNTDTQEVKQLFRELNTALETLPDDMEYRIFTLTCQLCGLHKQAAFREGLLVGFRLYNEMDDKL